MTRSFSFLEPFPYSEALKPLLRKFGAPTKEESFRMIHGEANEEELEQITELSMHLCSDPELIEQIFARVQQEEDSGDPESAQVVRSFVEAILPVPGS